LAGPGAGKTLVLIHRTAKLIERGVDPRGMLLTTFTRKAADEIRRRLGELIEPGVADRVFINTIHALCLHLLYKRGEEREVVTTAQSKRVIKTVLGYEHLDWDTGWKSVFGYVNEARIAGCRPPDEARDFYQAIFKSQSMWLVRRMTDVFAFYGQTKPGIDFVDMIMLVWHRLREDGMFAIGNQQRFTHILIDELQDTSRRAFEILRELARPQDKVFGVGDPDQELYRWNGADPYHNVFGFPDVYANTKVIKLEVNYRSTEKIIEASNNLIRHNYDEGDELLKVLEPAPDAETGQEISCVAHDDTKEEGRWVAGEIQMLMAEHWEPGQVFVMMRTNAQSRAIEDALVRVKIPYVIAGKVGFYGRKHIKDVLAYLALVLDDHDDEAFKRVANIASREHHTHFRGFGKAFFRECGMAGDSLWHGMMNLAQEFDRSGPSMEVTRFKRRGIDDFIGLVVDLAVTVKSPALIIRAVRELCYEPWYLRSEGLSSADEAEGSILNDLDELQYAAIEFDTVRDLLDHARELQEIQEKEESEAEAVVLTTIHKAKGLERDIVFVIGFSNELLPHHYSLGRGDEPLSAGLPVRRVTGVKDERCAAFVAISRAKQICYLSSLRSYRGKALEPSMFLGEILGGEEG